MNHSVKIDSETRLVRDVVYEKIKEAILTKRYKPGDHLVEREIASQFNISTTPLKEAIGLLNGNMVQPEPSALFQTIHQLFSIQQDPLPAILH